MDQGITLTYERLNDVNFILNLNCSRQISFQIVERHWDSISNTFNVTALSSAGSYLVLSFIIGCPILSVSQFLRFMINVKPALLVVVILFNTGIMVGGAQLWRSTRFYLGMQFGISFLLVLKLSLI